MTDKPTSQSVRSDVDRARRGAELAELRCREAQSDLAADLARSQRAVLSGQGRGAIVGAVGGGAAVGGGGGVTPGSTGGAQSGGSSDYKSNRRGSQGRTRSEFSQRSSAADRHLSERTLENVRADSQRTMRVSSSVAGMIRRDTAMAVGRGMRLQVLSADERFNTEAEALFAQWWYVCDRRGVLNFGAMQRMGWSARKVDGDVAFVKVRSEDAAGLGTLQAIEGARIVSPRGGVGGGGARLPEGASVHSGVEFDRLGRLSGFWIAPYTAHGGVDQSAAERVDRRDVIFLPRRTRFSATRGEPALARIVDIADQIDGAIESASISMRVQACQAMWRRRSTGAQAQTLIAGEVVDRGDGTREYQEDMAPGQIHNLGIGEEMGMLSSQAPGPNFPDALRVMTRVLGADLDMPLELALLDLSTSSAYAGRTGINLYHKAMEAEREDYVGEFLRPVYRWLIGTAMTAGLLPFVADWDRHRWMPPPRLVFEPDKEVAANVAAVNAGLKTRREICEDAGVDLIDHLDQLEEEQRLMAKRNIAPIHAPGTSAANETHKGTSAASETQSDNQGAEA